MLFKGTFMVLTSIERLLRFSRLEDNATNRRNLNLYMHTVSNQIQSYLNTDFALAQKTEYFDVRNTERQFWVRAIPIVTIDSVYHDASGEYDGSEAEVTGSIIGKNNRSVILDYSLSVGRKVIRIIYTGGVSTTATKSTFAVSNIQGTFLVDRFVTGSNSGAVGIVSAFDSSAETIQIDTLYGIFSTDDSLTMQTTEGGIDIAGIGCDIDSITVQSFSEIYPEISLAVDTQIDYLIRTSGDSENTSVQKDGVSRRSVQTEITFRGAYQTLQPEARSLINAHRRLTL